MKNDNKAIQAENFQNMLIGQLTSILKKTLG